MRRRIKERLAASAQPFLEDDDVVQQAFRAGRLLTGTRRRAVNIVVGTQRDIVVLGTSPWSSRKATHRIARVPRSTPMSLRLGTLTIGDMRFWVTGISAHPQARELVATAQRSAP